MANLTDYDRVCFFAHFDHADMVDPYVIRYLSRLREHGFGIVFVSAAHLSAEDTERLRPLCDFVIQRTNEGLDFGSWSDAFDRYSQDLRGDLLLANDSVYGPLDGMNNVFDRFASSHADYFGLVESFEIAPHLQSWFLLFRPHVYRSQDFARVLAQPFGRMTKREIIRAGEVGLATALRRAGFTYDAMFSPRQVCAAPSLCKINPSIMLWRELPTMLGVPFVKVQALRDNPYAEKTLAEWPRLVESLEPGISALIKEHLARSGPRRAVHRRLVLPILRWRNAFIHKQMAAALRTKKKVGILPTLVFYMVRLVSLAVSRVKWLTVGGAQ